MTHDEQSWPERRQYPRLEMYAGIFMVKGERAYLTEMQDISAGGLSVTRPSNWQADPEGVYQLFCVLEQERILCLLAQVTHDDDQSLGFSFEPGYAVQAEQLLAESRNWR